MFKKRFVYNIFDITEDFEEDNLKLYEIDNNPSDDLDESNLFYMYSSSESNIKSIVDKLNSLVNENEQLKSENKRLTDKLNRTALELVDGVISQGKATEISEMSYREFLDYRAKNGKPMELQL